VNFYELIPFLCKPTKRIVKYLALGDSYTIGEMVAPVENFPNQVCRLLQEAGVKIDPPRIIARTGWTTSELEEGIRADSSLEEIGHDHDLVTLLIGVNNQYRGLDVAEYEKEFGDLLNKAISYAGNDVRRVVVLSIPDWGVTPFAEGRNRENISAEIDLFNSANKRIAGRYHIYYIDITAWTREASVNPGLLASDGLHPSGAEYKRWAEKIVAYVKQGVPGTWT
jgi:lysophospholipase L1-like esterase